MLNKDSISDNYFHYVTETEGVIYYKIMTDGILTGGIHSELHGKTVYLSVCVDEKYRRLGIAEKALKKIISVTVYLLKGEEIVNE